MILLKSGAPKGSVLCCSRALFAEALPAGGAAGESITAEARPAVSKVFLNLCLIVLINVMIGVGKWRCAGMMFL